MPNHGKRNNRGCRRNRYRINPYFKYKLNLVDNNIEEKQIHPFRGQSKKIKNVNWDSQVKNKRIKAELDLRVEKLKNKIQEEMDSRINFIQKYISKDDECFKKNKKNYYILKKNFIDFLVNQSKFSLLKKNRLKKKLVKLRINFDKNKIYLLIFNKKGYINKENQYKSIIYSSAPFWKEWEYIISLIGNNIENFKDSVKNKELNILYKEYERIKSIKPQKDTIICEDCGSENSKKAIYCYYCGEKLKSSKI
ncbi:MAG: zinc ribbon domain-containing protein [Candidatus Lokiarchaeota archaeon]|nr:zinc ribbon domain-containing protein [Candidatus Lokiarchaeota archaeon]